MVLPLIAAALPAVAGLVGELFKGGGDKGGGDAGKGAGLGSLLGAAGGAPKMISDVIADHPVTKGTDLPPILAAMMSDKIPSSGHLTAGKVERINRIGKPGVLAPALERAISKIATDQAARPVQEHQEKAARAQVRRVNAAVQPQLKQLHKRLTERALQVQATAEHKAIVNRDRRWKQVSDHHKEILSRLDRIGQRLDAAIRTRY